ncbi:hypothetical protein GCM10008910_43860 [Faecalicatena orotica]|uniref:Uncharacterized protein n=1 Tax=Faecalicatena orotica TaxID=1544 RepID=A0A2Y9BHA1_9FIRM|nr:hypothetical protein [Faecalicatena orotica]PWJ23805.1 hypothetical protein A8806_11250 [Faecalicatena orotica]SSA57364.1 hypothetical protein SAMN05216536_11250 [Faecalicatena orotica]
MSEENHVAYQNKDIVAKYLAEHFSDKSFAAYGVKVPRIVEVLPTNLPVIEANELRLDNLFLLEDGSLALVDYESSYADADKIKYLNYIIRTLKRSMTEDNIMRKIRMIVIYTADIAPGQTRSNLDIGCLQFQLEEAFLTELDSVKIEDGIREKLNRGESLTAEEQMQFIILPLTYRGREKKEACIRRCFDMAKQVEDAQEQVFILSGILVFADKVIDNEDSKEMREWIMMTKVSKLFEEEKIEYGRKVAAEVSEKAAKATKEAVEKATRENEIGIVKRMLSNGIPLEHVKAVVTILTEEEVKDLQKEVKRQNNND